jgi:hypothetical protein
MDDFFAALASLPDMFKALVEYPRRFFVLLVVVVFCVSAAALLSPRKQMEIAPAVVKPEPERRITKIAKWLWEKE